MRWWVGVVFESKARLILFILPTRHQLGSVALVALCSRLPLPKIDSALVWSVASGKSVENARKQVRESYRKNGSDTTKDNVKHKIAIFFLFMLKLSILYFVVDVQSLMTNNQKVLLLVGIISLFVVSNFVSLIGIGISFTKYEKVQKTKTEEIPLKTLRKSAR